jgi:hypothetical protein
MSWKNPVLNLLKRSNGTETFLSLVFSLLLRLRHIGQVLRIKYKIFLIWHFSESCQNLFYLV